MKKILAMLLCLTLVLSLAACGTETPAPTEETQVDTEIDEVTAPTEPPYVFEPVVLVDNETVTLTIADYTPGMDNDCMDIQVQNKTDKNLYVNFKDPSINGLMYPGASFSLLVAPKETLQEYCFLPWEDLQAMGIPSVTQFEFTVNVLDGENYAEDPLYTDTFTIYPYGEDKAEDWNFAAAQSDIVVVDNESCAIIILGAQPGYPDGYQVKLYLQNKTDMTLSFTAEDAKLNGKDCDPLWIIEVAPGKQAVSTVTWEASTLEKADISTVEKILLELRVSDADNWRASAIAEAEIEFSPF